jgi:hypothetical protein
MKFLDVLIEKGGKIMPDLIELSKDVEDSAETLVGYIEKDEFQTSFYIPPTPKTECSVAWLINNNIYTHRSSAEHFKALQKSEQSNIIPVEISRELAEGISQRTPSLYGKGLTYEQDNYLKILLKEGRKPTKKEFYRRLA